MKTWICIALSFLFTLSLSAAKTQAELFPLDADYEIQGEYTGEISGGKFGAQVIALGGKKFDAVFYPGGLPGDGWDADRRNRLKMSGETKGEHTVFEGRWTATIANGMMTISNGTSGELERIIRKSPTLGLKPKDAKRKASFLPEFDPSKAIILFEGKEDAANFKQRNGKDARVDGEGLLVQGVNSKQLFQSYILHMEFRTPYKPNARGQDRGNAGHYAQGRYEVQILDSFGLEGAMNEAGGIYSVSAPILNMCYPPMTWQTYDIEFSAARFNRKGKKWEHAMMTVWHNGVLIHKSRICDHSTTASPLKEGPKPGPINFQEHSNPVRFRNVWVVPKK